MEDRSNLDLSISSMMIPDITCVDSPTQSKLDNSVGGSEAQENPQNKKTTFSALAKCAVTTAPAGRHAKQSKIKQSNSQVNLKQ